MKKKYVKPELLFEQYMLNQHMASSCQIEFTEYGSPESCMAVGNAAKNFGGVTLFMEQKICGMDMASVENYCYYLSTDSVATLSLHGSGG